MRTFFFVNHVSLFSKSPRRMSDDASSICLSCSHDETWVIVLERRLPHEILRKRFQKGLMVRVSSMTSTIGLLSDTTKEKRRRRPEIERETFLVDENPVATLNEKKGKTGKKSSIKGQTQTFFFETKKTTKERTSACRCEVQKDVSRDESSFMLLNRWTEKFYANWWRNRNIKIVMIENPPSKRQRCEMGVDMTN